jgi:hypothetical protein
MKTITIKRDQVKEVLAAIPHTAFFGVTFTKVNGSTRKMSCNKSISVGLKNKKVPTEIKSSSLGVYDVHASGYRRVNLETVSAIRANKTLYIVQ